MQKFIWDTSAIVNIKESNEQGYSPGYSLYKDLADNLLGSVHLITQVNKPTFAEHGISKVETGISLSSLGGLN